MCAGLGRLALAATVLALWSGPEARAASVMVVGNYPATNNGTLSSVTSLYGTYAKAVGFTMGGQSDVLSSVTLRLAEQVGSNSTLSVALYGGSSGVLSGPVLTSFDVPSIPSVAGNVTFTPTTAITLQAGETYWLELSGQSNTLNGIVWYASNPGVIPSGVAATSAGALFTDELGILSALEPSSVFNTFQVMGSSGAGIVTVPEPTGLTQGAVSVLAGLVYACWQLRRRRGGC